MPDYRIKSVHAVQVQSRRHNMAVSARVETMDGAVGKALCYAGVSVGTHEVHFQYDGGNRWGGLGCMSAVRNVNTIIADTILGIANFIVIPTFYYPVICGMCLEAILLCIGKMCNM